MASQPDFMKQAEAFSRQAWEAWARQWQAGAAVSGKPPVDAHPWSGQHPGASAEQSIKRSLDSFTSYLDWLQRAATSGMEQGGDGGWEGLRNLFAQAPMAQQPFAQPFLGLFPPSPAWPFAAAPSAAAGATPLDMLQPWLAQLQQGLGAGDWRSALQTPSFGYTREQQQEQQALVLAMLDHQQASQRYQHLLLRAQQQGAERLQRKLAEPGRKVASLKALYDLWVDAAEEAYAEIALSDEFREVYAAQVNTQMRLRQLQQQQIERACRELGLPTRGDVDSLSRRLHELRRELRRGNDEPRDRGALAATDAGSQPVERQAAPAAERKTAVKTSISKPAKMPASPKKAAARPAGGRGTSTARATSKPAAPAPRKRR